jgi:acyl phosphate:glycerol-3-phosphate acyltransferase
MSSIGLLDWQTWAWAGFGFACGMLPFSVWLGRWVKGQDVRQVGDHNPGAVNALRLGGWRLGLAALLLDVSKGALPLGLAYQVFGLRGVGMFVIALAPVLGHAFSPLLGGRGGKALAVTLGVWIGLILGWAPLIILTQLTFWYLILAVDGWAVLFTGLGTLAILALAFADPLLAAILVGQLALLAWKQRADLRQRPALRGALLRRLGRK